MKKIEKKAAVLGFPIKHSLSPVIHNYWIKKYKIPGKYDLFKTNKNQLKKTIYKLQQENYLGANLTIPLKEKVISIIDKIDRTADFTKSVNTIVFRKNSIEGKNTDVYGFKKSLDKKLKNKKKRALVLGAGGASRAVVYSLVDMGFEKVEIYNRTKSKATKLKKDMDKLPFKKNQQQIIVKDIKNIEMEIHLLDLFVNTTPLGMKGFKKKSISLKQLDKKAIVFDLVYNPLETDLLKSAKKNGNATINGLEMLIFQAQPAFKQWFNINPKIDKNLKFKLKKLLK